MPGGFGCPVMATLLACAADLTSPALSGNGTLRQFAALQRGVRSWGKTARRRDPNKVARIDPTRDVG